MIAIGPFLCACHCKDAFQLTGEIILCLEVKGLAGENHRICRSVLDEIIAGIYHGNKLFVACSLVCVNPCIYVLFAEQRSQHFGVCNVAISLYGVRNTIVGRAITGQDVCFRNSICQCLEILIGCFCKIHRKSAFQILLQILGILNRKDGRHMLRVKLRSKNRCGICTGAKRKEFDLDALLSGVSINRSLHAIRDLALTIEDIEVIICAAVRCRGCSLCSISSSRICRVRARRGAAACQHAGSHRANQ